MSILSTDTDESHELSERASGVPLAARFLRDTASQLQLQKPCNSDDHSALMPWHVQAQGTLDPGLMSNISSTWQGPHCVAANWWGRKGLIARSPKFMNLGGAHIRTESPVLERDRNV